MLKSIAPASRYVRPQRRNLDVLKMLPCHSFAPTINFATANTPARLCMSLLTASAPLLARTQSGAWHPCSSCKAGTAVGCCRRHSSRPASEG